MTEAFDSGLQSNLRFVLVAYADHADDDGGNIYPSVAMVMRKTGYSRRTVQLLTRKLVETGWLIPDGGGPKGTNRFRLGSPEGGGRNLCAGAISARGGAICDTEGAQSTTGGVQPVAPESSVEPTTEPSREPSTHERVRATSNSTPQAMRAERGDLLASLERFAPGFGEAWSGWRAALPSSKKWTLWAQVLKLRTFVALSLRYSPADLLDMATMGAERGWQGFEVAWWERERRNGGQLPFRARPTRPGFNAADSEDLDAVVIRQGGPCG